MHLYGPHTWAPYICMGKMLRILNDFPSEAAGLGSLLGAGELKIAKMVVLP